MNEKQPAKRGIKSFVIRGGRMTRGQENAWQNVWPSMGLNVEDGLLNQQACFGRCAPLVLEIGFGMGASLVTMAQQDPDSNFIGVEVHKPGVGALMMSAEAAGLKNLAVYCADANDVLKCCIEDESLERVQLFFPDPWHKKKHNKRRLVQPEFVQALRVKLRVGGVFHMATDWEPYAEHMLEVMEAAPGFSNCVTSGGYSEKPDYRPETKFERRGQRLGHGVWDILYTRMS